MKEETMYNFFLPFIGEFGHYITKHVRGVYHCGLDNVIVSCKRGEECLFPTANGFFYDWEDIPDKQKMMCITANKRWRECIKKAEKIYENIQIHRPIGKINMIPAFVPVSDIEIPKIDVCVGARKREHARAKNYQYWQDVIDMCRSRGLVVAVVGKRDMTANLDADYYSYDYSDSTDAVVAMINKAKTIINSDSGLAHLTTLMQKEQIVIKISEGPGRTKWIFWNRPELVRLVDHRAFLDKQFGLDVISAYLDETNKY